MTVIQVSMTMKSPVYHRDAAKEPREISEANRARTFSCTSLTTTWPPLVEFGGNGECISLSRLTQREALRLDRAWSEDSWL